MTTRCLSRAEAIHWARNLLSKADFCVLDTETTGLDDCAEPVQIGVLDHDGTVLLNTLIKPPCPIPASAIVVHGIRDADVAEAPTLEEILPHLQAILADRRVVVYNLLYDAPLLERCLRRRDIGGLGRTFPSTRWTCAMEPYAAYVGVPGRYGKGWKWQPLPSGDHSAIGDCLACLEVVKTMAEAGE